MISYLSSHALTINERLEDYDTNLREVLDEMYGQILGLVNKSTQSSRMLLGESSLGSSTALSH